MRTCRYPRLLTVGQVAVKSGVPRGKHWRLPCGSLSATQMPGTVAAWWWQVKGKNLRRQLCSLISGCLLVDSRHGDGGVVVCQWQELVRFRRAQQPGLGAPQLQHKDAVVIKVAREALRACAMQKQSGRVGSKRIVRRASQSHTDLETNTHSSI